MNELEEIEIPETNSYGRRINMNQNYDIATLRFLETLDDVELDRDGNIIAGEIPQGLRKYLNGLISKSVPLANKKFTDAYVTYHQIEEIIMETWDILAKETIKKEIDKGTPVKDIINLLRLCFIQLDNLKKTAYDMESRNTEGSERRMLNTNITQSVQTADITNKHGIQQQPGLGDKINKAFKM